MTSVVIGQRDAVVGEPLCSTVVRVRRAAIEGRALVAGRVDRLVLVMDEVAVDVQDGREDGVALGADGLGRQAGCSWRRRGRLRRSTPRVRCS